LAERSQNIENMLKRNFTMILIIITMILNILNFGFINKSVGTFNFWFTLASILLLIAAIIKIFITENKENNKTESD
jgi:hypothetical protein